MATVSKLSVIVAQFGADVSVCGAATHLAEAILVEQKPDETATQLTSRVRARLAELAGAGRRVHDARFVVRKGFDVRDVMAAAGLLRGLVSAMVAAGTAQVHLHAEPSDLQTRYALTALGDAMRDQLQGTGVDFVTHLASPTPAGVPTLPLRTPQPTSSLPR
jgi:hypothetical protein